MPHYLEHATLMRVKPLTQLGCHLIQRIFRKTHCLSKLFCCVCVLFVYAKEKKMPLVGLNQSVKDRCFYHAKSPHETALSICMIQGVIQEGLCGVPRQKKTFLRDQIQCHKLKGGLATSHDHDPCSS